MNRALLAVALVGCSRSDPPAPTPAAAPAPPVAPDAAPAVAQVVDAAVDALVGTGEGSGISWGSIDGQFEATGVTVKVGKPDIDGDLDKAIVSRIVKQNLARIRGCYTDALAKQPKLAGTVVAKFAAGADGKVSSSTATGVDPKVADCIAAALRDIELPRSHTGVQASFPFTFSVEPAIEPAQIIDDKMLASDDPIRTIRQHMRELQSCYKQALRKRPNLKGKVVATFTIGADGKVTASAATGLDPEVADCIAAAIRAIEFPKPRDGKAVEQTFPFTFIQE